jgi:hypothetical protein
MDPTELLREKSPMDDMVDRLQKDVLKLISGTSERSGKEILGSKCGIEGNTI